MKPLILMSLFGIAVASSLTYVGASIGPAFSIPDTISREAKAAFDERFNSLESRAMRALTSLPDNSETDEWISLQAKAEAAVATYNEGIVNTLKPEITTTEINGTEVLDIRPQGWQDNGKVLVYLHGGAYVFYSASSTLLSSVSMADATGLRVISVNYTLAPHADYVEIQDEVLSVIQGLNEAGYDMDDMAMFGESAGGGLVAAIALKLRDQDIGMPKALVLWSPWSDVTNNGDTYHTLQDAEPTYRYDKLLRPSALAYAPESKHKDPYVSPVYGDFAKGYPPTLIQAGTKEIFLSNAVRMYQALDDAGQEVKLDVYEGMWHVFQIHIGMPEADKARAKAAQFILKNLQ